MISFCKNLINASFRSFFISAVFCSFISSSRDCGQFILTKEEWKQREQKRRNGRLSCHSALPVYDSPLVVEKIVPPHFFSCIAPHLFSTEPCRSFCKEYKECRLCFLSSTKIYESNKLCQLSGLLSREKALPKGEGQFLYR